MLRLIIQVFNFIIIVKFHFLVNTYYKVHNSFHRWKHTICVKTKRLFFILRPLKLRLVGNMQLCSCNRLQRVLFSVHLFYLNNFARTHFGLFNYWNIIQYAPKESRRFPLSIYGNIIPVKKMWQKLTIFFLAFWKLAPLL